MANNNQTPQEPESSDQLRQINSEHPIVETTDENKTIDENNHSENSTLKYENIVAPVQKTDSKNKVSSGSKFLSRFLPFLLALIATSLFAYIYFPLVEPNSFLQRLFLPEGKPTIQSTSIPLTALFLFLWSMFDILTILFFIRNERKPLFENRLLFAREGIKNGFAEKINQEWKGSRQGRTFVRIFSLAEVLESSNNSQRGYEFFRYQSDLDTEKATSKYTLTKIAIWAMPILGFIGTVLGIGLAIGHFSEFLNQDIDDIAKVKGELAKVATGLSYAFFSTLFGLALSMFMMFVSTFIQNFEESYLTRLEETCFSILETFKTDKTPKIQTQPSIITPVDGMLEKFNVAIDEKVKQVSADVTALITQLETASKNMSSEFGKIPVLMEKNNEQFNATIEIVTGQLEAMKKGFTEIAQKSNEIYHVDLAPVLNNIHETNKALLPALEKLSKPIELTITAKKENHT